MDEKQKEGILAFILWSLSRWQRRLSKSPLPLCF